MKLDSQINKGPWSMEENQRLHQAVAEYSTVWVPSLFAGSACPVHRSETHCIALCRWTEVAQVVGTRQADREYSFFLCFVSSPMGLIKVECAKRWQHFLNPGLDRSEWTPEEDEILLSEVEKRGRNWKQIVDEVLQRRSPNDAKNR
jgi:hypothetical protein